MTCALFSDLPPDSVLLRNRLLVMDRVEKEGELNDKASKLSLKEQDLHRREVMRTAHSFLSFQVELVKRESLSAQNGMQGVNAGLTYQPDMPGRRRLSQGGASDTEPAAALPMPLEPQLSTEEWEAKMKDMRCVGAYPELFAVHSLLEQERGVRRRAEFDAATEKAKAEAAEAQAQVHAAEVEAGRERVADAEGRAQSAEGKLAAQHIEMEKLEADRSQAMVRVAQEVERAVECQIRLSEAETASRSAKDELEQSRAQRDHAREELKAESQRYYSERNMLESQYIRQLDELRKRFKDLEQLLRSRDAEIEDLKKKLADVSASEKAERRRAFEYLERAEAAEAKLRDQVAAPSAGLDASSRIETENQDLKDLQEQLAAKEAQNKLCQEKCQQLTNQTNALKMSLSNESAAGAKLKEQLQTSDARARELMKSKDDELKAERAQTQAAQTRAEEHAKRAEALLEEHEAAAAAAIATIKEGMKVEAESHQREVQGLGASINELRVMIKVRVGSDELEKEMEELRKLALDAIAEAKLAWEEIRKLKAMLKQGHDKAMQLTLEVEEKELQLQRALLKLKEPCGHGKELAMLRHLVETLKANVEEERQLRIQIERSKDEGVEQLRKHIE
eukprot:gene6125-7348_t